MGKGFRMIEGKAFVLNGTCAGYSPDDVKKKMQIEKTLKESQGFIVRFIKRTSTTHGVYTFPRE